MFYSQAIPNYMGPSAEHAGQHYPLQAIRSEVNRFVTKAGDLANQILTENSPKPYQGPVIIRNHYHFTPWHYNPYPSVIVVGDHCHGRRQKDDDGGRILLGILATVGALIASYAVGSAIVTHQDASSELDEAKQARLKFQEFAMHAVGKDQELVSEALEASHLKKRICKRMKNSAVTDLALRITLAVGLGMIAGAAFVAAPQILALGLVSSVVAGGAMLFKWGFESSSSANLRDAQALNESLKRLKQLQ